MAQGWGPGTREIQNASRDTIMERWGETPIGRGSTQIAASRGVGCGPPASSFFDSWSAATVRWRVARLRRSGPSRALTRVGMRFGRSAPVGGQSR